MPVGKKRLQNLRLGDALDRDIFLDVGSASGSGLRDRGPLSPGSDLDCFTYSPTGASAAVESSEPPVEARNPRPEDISFEKQAAAHAQWLKTAIEAEHIEELAAQLRRLGGSREKLVAEGSLLEDLVITCTGRDTFTLSRMDESAFDLFSIDLKLNSRVTICRDTRVRDGDKSDSDAGDNGRGDSSSNKDEESDAASGKEDGNTDEPWALRGERNAAAGAPADGAAAAAPAQDARSAKVRSHAEEVLAHMCALGLQKLLDGNVVKITDRELTVRSRFNDAVQKVEDALAEADPSRPPRWAVICALQDSTYRRQADAADALATVLYSRTPAPQQPATAGTPTAPPPPQQQQADAPGVMISLAAQVALARPGEVRVRRVLLAKGEDEQAASAAGRALAAEPVEWLGEAEQREVEALLCGPGVRLNRDQRGALLKASKRSVTLIQGPPGTGKTCTLTAMAAALYQVLHRPPPALPNNTYKFDLPRSNRDVRDMKNWREEEVVEWIQSFQDPKLPRLKELALRVTEGCSGQAVLSRPLPLLHQHFRQEAKSLAAEEAAAAARRDAQAAAAGKGAAPRPAAAGEIDARAGASMDMDPDGCARAFDALRKKVPEAIEQCRKGEGPWSSAYWRTGGRDMRMVLCADTNTAANRLLEMLVDQLPHPEECSVLRMGIVNEGEEGSAIARKYHIDKLRDQHPLMKISERLRTALNADKLTSDLGLELEAEVKQFVKELRIKAEQSRRLLVREKRLQLADLIASAEDKAAENKNGAGTDKKDNNSGADKKVKAAKNGTAGNGAGADKKDKAAKNGAAGSSTGAGKKDKAAENGFASNGSDADKEEEEAKNGTTGNGSDADTKAKEREAVATKLNSQLTAYRVAKREGDAQGRKCAEKGLKATAHTLREITLYDILLSVEVVVGTHSSMGEIRSICQKHGLTFPIVIIDEAGQASEPSCMISLTLGSEWVLMGGDTKQLPPTLRSDVARELLGFETETGGSLYGRLLQMGVLECGLNMQYRMHKAISAFPSRMFYGGRLRVDPESEPNGKMPEPTVGCYGFKPFTNDFPVIFFKYDVGIREDDGYGGGAYRLNPLALEQRTSSDPSLFNELEAYMALQLLMALASDPTIRSIFIVTPYKAQADYISKRLGSGERVINNFRRAGTFHAEEYGAHTVDGYQGREADVVIFSTVRSNGSGDIGHLLDTRRLNVAITRARRGLLIVGNVDTLRQRPGPAFNGRQLWCNLWPELLRYIEENGAVMEPEAFTLPPLPQALGYLNTTAAARG